MAKKCTGKMWKPICGTRRGGGWDAKRKYPPQKISLFRFIVTPLKVGINSQNFLTLRFNTFATLL